MNTHCSRNLANDNVGNSQRILSISMGVWHGTMESIKIAGPKLNSHGKLIYWFTPAAACTRSNSTVPVWVTQIFLQRCTGVYLDSWLFFLINVHYIGFGSRGWTDMLKGNLTLTRKNLMCHMPKMIQKEVHTYSIYMQAYTVYTYTYASDNKCKQVLYFSWTH